VKTVFAVCATLTALGMLLNPSPAYSQDGGVSLDDVILLAQTDISDQTVLVFLKYRNLSFVLDADAVRRLSEAGVSEQVITYLLTKDAAPVAAAPTYVVSTGYNTTYPSYYYGTRLVGTTAYRLSWYNHHYYPFGYAAGYRPGAHYDSGSGVGHSVGIALGHDGAPIHTPGILGGEHQIGHSAVGLGHSIGLGQSHSRGSGRGHVSGRSGGHGSSH
jgi:hypothetical protein